VLERPRPEALAIVGDNCRRLERNAESGRSGLLAWLRKKGEPRFEDANGQADGSDGGDDSEQQAQHAGPGT
jgi:hypothetical protein